MAPKEVEKEYTFLLDQFQSVDDDLYEKKRELEIAYDEAFEWRTRPSASPWFEVDRAV